MYVRNTCIEGEIVVECDSLSSLEMSQSYKRATYACESRGSNFHRWRVQKNTPSDLEVFSDESF